MGWLILYRVHQRLRSSLSIVPLLFAAAGFWLVTVLAKLDAAVPVPPELTFSESTATQLLGVIVGAMISLLGVFFAFFVLITQAATSQLSPRALGLLYRDPRLKFALGIIVGTLTFALVLLARVRAGFVPSASVGAAAALVLLSIVAFLSFLNHAARSIRPASVADRILEEGLAAMRRVLAPRRGEAEPAGAGVPALAGGEPVRRRGRSGVLQAVDLRGVAAAAERHGAVIVMSAAVGDFVRPGATLGTLHRDAGSRRVRQGWLRWRLAVGPERELHHDPAFALRLLVDIASRALSPAINDPTTAVQMLDRIEVLLHELAWRRLGPTVLRDRSGTPRLLMPSPTWTDLLRLAVCEVRLYGAQSVQVTRRLRALLDAVDSAAPSDRRGAVRDELALLDASVRDGGNDPAFAGAGDHQGLGASRPAEPPALH